MLRISTRSEESRSSTAAGGAPDSRPELGSGRSKGPEARPHPLEGKNHAAELVDWVTGELRFHSVLDLSCEDGEAVDRLAELGYEAYGLDLRPGASGGVPTDRGFYDLVICANHLQKVSAAEVATLLADIDHLSSSYALLSVPGAESGDAAEGEIRPVRWWCDRIADLHWRIRFLREDPESGQLVILAEKRDSLAAQVLPLLDASSAQEASSAPQAPAPAPKAAPAPAADPATLQARDRSLALARQALALFETDQADAAYLRISEMAHAMAPTGHLVPGIYDILGRLVDAMERRDRGATARCLEEEIVPALAAIA